MIFNMAGGGAPLNFQLEGGLTQPTNPKENTIWVNTSADITGWSIGAETPAAPAEGMVWINIGGSVFGFNALKKNAIVVKPSGASQYISGTWVKKSAYIYQSGAWSYLETYLFKNGEIFDILTGGWSEGGYTYSDSKYSTFTINTPNVGSTLYMYSNAENQAGVAGTAKKIDLSPFSKIRVVCTEAARPGAGIGGGIAVTNDSKNLAMSKAVAYADVAVGTTELDVSGINGEYYIALISRPYPGGYATSIRISEVELL